MTREFIVPLYVGGSLVLYLLFTFLFHLDQAAVVIALIAITAGSFSLVKKSLVSLARKQFALDYIAILAITVGLITHEYLVSVILALMISGGRALEAYGVRQAKKSLTKLINRIPNKVTIWSEVGSGETEEISEVKIGEQILVRKGEVIPLDGVLISENGETDESSLTGEPYFMEKSQGDILRSGTINIGTPIVIRVTREEKDSTYKKIIDMVQRAQKEKPPMIRLADRYSVVFTGVTLAISAAAYLGSGFNLERVLSVLAIATPCPLIIATPIALLGGMNASAKKKIIIKKLSAIEILAGIRAIVFDKTGTITLGRPKLTDIKVVDKQFTREKALAIAQAIEKNSLHPLAKAIVEFSLKGAKEHLRVADIREEIGRGIFGTVGGKTYSLLKVEGLATMTIGLSQGGRQIALFSFSEEIKEESRETIVKLKKIGLELYIYTGDKMESTKKIVEKLGSEITILASLSPADKQKGINKLKQAGKPTAMVGDGINDAPALAAAGVGIAFSNEEQTAASEAADIVILGGNFSTVLDSWVIARRTIYIATQSIKWGIGLSILGMIFASVGLIPPIYSAGLQEAIDVAVILNALRASK